MQNVDEKYEKEFQERDTKAEIKCTIVSSMEKVFPKIAPKECVKKLAGLRGETVSFQIAYFWNGKTKLLGEISDISVDCRLDGMAGEPFSAKDISVRKVLLVPSFLYPFGLSDGKTEKQPYVGAFVGIGRMHSGPTPESGGAVPDQ